MILQGDSGRRCIDGDVVVGTDRSGTSWRWESQVGVSALGVLDGAAVEGDRRGRDVVEFFCRVAGLNGVGELKAAARRFNRSVP